MPNEPKEKRKLSFDLTSLSSMRDAIAKSSDRMSDVLQKLQPQIQILDKTSALIGSVFKSADDTIKEQRETALELIKAGKESGVESIELTLDQKVGASLSGVGNVEATLGKSGKMIIKVKYK